MAIEVPVLFAIKYRDFFSALYGLISEVSGMRNQLHYENGVKIEFLCPVHHAGNRKAIFACVENLHTSTHIKYKFSANVLAAGVPVLFSIKYKDFFLQFMF